MAVASTSAAGTSATGSTERRSETELRSIFDAQTGQSYRTWESMMDKLSRGVWTDPSDDAALREKEVALVQLGELYRDQGCASSSTIGMDGWIH